MAKPAIVIACEELDKMLSEQWRIGLALASTGRKPCYGIMHDDDPVCRGCFHFSDCGKEASARAFVNEVEEIEKIKRSIN